MNRILKTTVRIACIVVFLLASLCGFVNGYSYFWRFGRGNIDHWPYDVAFWLIIPSLACAIAAFVLTYKKTPSKNHAIIAGALALIAAGFLAFPFYFAIDVWGELIRILPPSECDIPIPVIEIV